MKNLLTVIFITCIAASVAHAQDLQIHRTDGTVITIPLAAIDSLTFVESGSDFVCGVSTVADVDGNVYSTVLIGTQCWMKENLKTTKYRNGTPIEYPGNDNTAWQNNTNGAYSWYNNEISWKDNYGALYNWRAVNNVNGLCPEGWHVPTDAEWNVLILLLDPNADPNAWSWYFESPQSEIAGGKMKSIRTVPDPHPRWNSPNTGADDEVSWAGLPGGSRWDGVFSPIGEYGFWWSATTDNNYESWIRFIYFAESNVFRTTTSNTVGCSVRCLKD